MVKVIMFLFGAILLCLSAWLFEGNMHLFAGVFLFVWGTEVIKLIGEDY